MSSQFIRIIPRLDIKNNNLIKGINLEGLRVLGAPYEYSQYYSNNGADEIHYSDAVASLYGTNNLTSLIKMTAKNLRIPLSVGGGIRSISDIEKILESGADKVFANTAFIENKKFINEAVKKFGSSTISSNIECIKIDKKYFISKSNGRDLVNIHPCEWAKKLEGLGIGEIIVTSVNSEGLECGFDLGIIKKISNSIKIPVLAHGGAGNFQHVLEVIRKTKISGVIIASMFHYKCINKFKFNFKNTVGNFYFLKNTKKSFLSNPIMELKNFLFKNKINIRNE